MAAKIIGRLPHRDCKSAISRNPDQLVKNIRRSFICSPLHVAFIMCHGWRCSFCLDMFFGFFVRTVSFGSPKLIVTAYKTTQAGVREEWGG